MNVHAMLMALSGFGRLIPSLLITAGCVIYLQKSKSGVAMALLAGNLLSVACGAASAILMVMMSAGTMNMQAYSRVAASLALLGFVASALFGGAFLYMAIQMEPEPPKSDGGENRT